MLLLRVIPNHDAKTFTNSAKKKITEIMKITTKKSFIIPAVFSLNSKSFVNKPIVLYSKIVMIFVKISNPLMMRIINIITFIDNFNHSFPKHIVKLYHKILQNIGHFPTKAFGKSG